MHPALQIQEILLNIFGRCRLPSEQSAASDLPALARTCRAFKEPALDVLWAELRSPSPIARCLPEASRHSKIPPHGNKCYSFSRSLTRVEWGILRNYTCRIRSIQDCNRELDWESVRTFLNPPTTEPLFPNIRYLDCYHAKDLLSMPFPCLISLCLESTGGDLRILQGSLESISKFSPNIKRLSIEFCLGDTMFNNFFSSYIRRWRDLQSVRCDGIALDVDALAHLSRMPALAQLAFTVSPTLPEQITSSDPPLFSPNLHDLALNSEFLDPISDLLSRTHIPTVTDLAAYIDEYPYKQDLSSFFASVQTSVIGHVIQGLEFWQLAPAFRRYSDGVPQPVLGFEDLEPCMAFNNLRHINLSIEWKVNLTSSELLALASAWPHLEHLLINQDWGWKTPGGIAPNGLLELLQTCPSLSVIALAIDTRRYTEFHPSSASVGLTLPPTFSMDVLDSSLEAESVPAIAAFLASIVSGRDFSFRASDGCRMGRTEYTVRWYDAYKQANDVLGLRL